MASKVVSLLDVQKISALSHKVQGILAGRGVMIVSGELNHLIQEAIKFGLSDSLFDPTCFLRQST
jgi:hypothetical protein